MTYISRGTRIIDSRWLDECDAEYKLRAFRKRSEGRLKTHTSCDDLRAWSNSDCITNGYLLDLMSDGESTGKSRVHLYGRYIPVPLLLKLFQGYNESSISQVFREDATFDNESGYLPPRGKQKNFSPIKTNNTPINVHSVNNNTNDSTNLRKEGIVRSEPTVDNNEALWKSQHEKCLLEKGFFECRSLLCQAVGRLEKIDSIICDGLNECENTKNIETEYGALQQSKSLCNCSVVGSNCCSNPTSRPSLKKMREMPSCTELLRKISDFKQKLKIINEKLHEVSEQIRMQRLAKSGSNQQVTELFCRRDEIRLKRLQRKSEKLISKKGQLLLEFAETINTLHKLKKSIIKSKSRLSFASKYSAPDDEFKCGVPVTCACGWQCTDNLDSMNSLPSVDTSQDSSSAITRRTDLTSSVENTERYSPIKRLDRSNTSRGYNYDDPWQIRLDANNNSNLDSTVEASSLKPFAGQKNDSMTDKEIFDREQRKGNKPKLERKSKLKFVCQQPACRKKSLSENFDNFQNVYFIEQEQSQELQRKQQQQLQYLSQQAHGNPIENISTPRPYTTPFTTQQNNLKNGIPERKIKSETTMEEIEKTLRNYEQRLKNLDSLENKIKKVKEKMAEGNRQKEEWMRQKAETKKMREAERDRSNKEITKLRSENWALKKKIRELMAKTDLQAIMFETNLKSSEKKLKEVNCEKELLQKEMSEYQESFQGQQKQICMLKNFVINQRTEIEKLTNLINRLSTPPVKCHQHKSVQGSRTCSLESIKTTKTFSRPIGQGGRFSHSSEEEDSWCCDERRQQEMKSQQRISGTSCCSPHGIRRRGRCVN